ncbi:acetate/propionate family kinase [Mycoplasma phocoeninasale]|uniref:Acetate kinase n=1 Tax=Mycoplasma phocoeninasale TaxID=2726117 RepID=A0A858U1W9_9MOLU|nr:acetate/propionate family kinase [Mycoplasma phocoeninasale]MBN0970413.1 acetate/propionate family kinase [Mycoplasma phocoeninasale]QJG66460.1 acetate/propionate family kinase [Mycoplasma phocoeninasale]
MSKILIINAGSSSIKWNLFSSKLQVEAKGVAQRIKMKEGILSLEYQGKKEDISVELPSFLETVKILVSLWKERQIISDFSEISQVAFRVVNGGINLQSTCEVNESSLSYLKDAIDLAPLHNPGAINAIEAFKEYLPNAKMTMHFDTSFHKTLSKLAYTYPINAKLSNELNIRKYGFHGLNHHYISLKTAEILNKKSVNMVSLHIGNGASLCAIENGKSIDTSMGFTPLAGIMMGSRSGDIDPSIIQYVMKAKNMSIDEVMSMLNEKSGMLGVSGISSDLRDVQKVKDSNPQAQFALDLYTTRIADYLINYLNKISGNIDAIVFTAGVGENDAYIRKEVVRKIKLLNLEIDDDINKNLKFQDYKLISTKNSSIPIFVIRAEEELYMAKEAINFFK